MKEFRLFENETPNQAIYRICKHKAEQTISVITEDGLECLYDVKF